MLCVARSHVAREEEFIDACGDSPRRFEGKHAPRLNKPFEQLWLPRPRFGSHPFDLAWVPPSGGIIGTVRDTAIAAMQPANTVPIFPHHGSWKLPLRAQELPRADTWWSPKCHRSLSSWTGRTLFRTAPVEHDTTASAPLDNLGAGGGPGGCRLGDRTSIHTQGRTVR